MCGTTYFVVSQTPLRLTPSTVSHSSSVSSQARRQREDAGVGAEDVDPAERLDRLFGHALAVRRLRHVGPDADGAPAERLDLPHRSLEVVPRRHPADALGGELAGDVRDRDVRSLAGEEQRHRPAEASRRP